MRRELHADADETDMGDIVVLLLTSTLAALSDRLNRDGCKRAADLVADLVEVADDYIVRNERQRPRSSST